VLGRGGLLRGEEARVRGGGQGSEPGGSVGLVAVWVRLALVAEVRVEGCEAGATVFY